MTVQRRIGVFIASPSDLPVERRAFKDTIDELNRGFGRGADVEFVPLGWEDALSQFGRRSQSVINQDVDACDIFVLAMWRRWGQAAPDATPFTSYTEEEFYRAVARFEKEGAPAIFVFFKQVDAAQTADAGPQLTQVLAFRRKLEETRKVLYRGFTNEDEFKVEIDRHLAAFAKRESAPPRSDRRIPMLPESIQRKLESSEAERRRAVDEIEKLQADARCEREELMKALTEAKDAAARAEAAAGLASAKAAEHALSLAESAAKAALDGNLERARQDFGKALDGTTNLRVLHLGFEFFQRTGDLEEAEALLERWLAISGREAETASTATAYGNIAFILRTRGDLDGAETMLLKALAIEEKLGRLEGVASYYGNLGHVLRTRRDLEQAKTMHRNALAINEKLSHLEGMASDYGNLGLVLRDQNELEASEAMFHRALTLEEKLGRLEGIAIQYGNLGSIWQRRGDLEQAEAIHRKAFAINEKLGRLEGMANNYGNLGHVLRARGELDDAEAMHRMALAINEKLGRLGGMADNHANLGEIRDARGDPEGAREHWTEARTLYAKLGASQRADLIRGWLAHLPPRAPSS